MTMNYMHLTFNIKIKQVSKSKIFINICTKYIKFIQGHAPQFVVQVYLYLLRVFIQAFILDQLSFLINQVLNLMHHLKVIVYVVFSGLAVTIVKIDLVFWRQRISIWELKAAIDRELTNDQIPQKGACASDRKSLQAS